jgi:3-oxoacyl-[acyl-carrier-protein] synthase II
MTSILLTGLGPVSPIGIGRDAWRLGLKEERCGIGECSIFALDTPVAEVRGLDIDAILPSQKTYLDRASEFALAAGQLALRDAGLTPQCCDRWRAGAVFGTEFGCLSTMYTYTAALQQKGARLANPLLFSHMYANAPASLAAIEFGFGGHHGTYTGKDAGLQALEAAQEALLIGRADVILAVGVDVLSEALVRALLAHGSLGDDLPGEGACAVVLETADHAAARGQEGMPLGDLLPPAGSLRRAIGCTFAAEPFFALAQHICLASAR